MPRFVHLHTHSEFSLVDGLVRIKPLIKNVQTAQMPACAITDFSNLCGLVQFYKAANAAGIKPIIGADVVIDNGDAPASRLILLCQNKRGYIHLSELISQAYLEGLKKEIPHLRREWFAKRSDGLIALSAGRLGDIGQALLSSDTEQAKQYLQFWQAHFPNRFYLELQRTGRPQEEDYIHAAVQLAIETHTPVVATNDVVFLKEEDYEAHEVRVCIHDGYVLDDNRRPRLYSPQQYLRSPEEMTALFSDIPEAIENTWRIAQRCNIELTLGKNYLPNFPVPEGMTMDEYFCELSRKGLDERFETVLKNKERQEYDERLQIELDVILQMGFPGYFLIVADFIQWSKDNGIPVGPGRGSGAGSIVAYALKITDLDPIEYDLLFERFLNPERVSMPDFDVDFCMEGRDRVIQYVAETYGKEHVSQIITFGTMAAKAVVRDVGRVLGHPYPFVDQISKLIPFEIGITLTKALEQEEQLKNRYKNDEDVRAIIDMALKLEGLTRNVGTHAGGVVIGPSKLTDFCPLYWDGDPDNTMVTQLDKNDVETIGLVKFDFLGLRTLTIIKWALENIIKTGSTAPDMLQIPLDDKSTFDLLKKAHTTAVFQLESRGMKELIKRLLPDCFEDIVALVALFRPGPLQSGMVDDFINRKHGRAKIEYPHPDLEPILKPTYGIILYQEQVMQISQVLANYTLGGADLLRRAMGKKKPEEMAKQRTTFTEGALKRNVDEKIATYVFDLMEKFAGYGFNKSHSAAYAFVSYQTAWLKTHYPAAFMAAVLSSDMDNTDKVVGLIDDCREMKLDVKPPHVNYCDYKFTIADNKTILYGLGAIKGVGENAIENIVISRKENQKFTDLFDFCKKIDLRKVNRRVLEALVKSGCFDNMGASRATLAASLDTAIKLAERHASDKNTGQNSLFGMFDAPEEKTEEKVPYAENILEWTDIQRLNGEKDCLGLYLTGHPIDQYKTELQNFSYTPLSKVRPTNRGATAKIIGLVLGVRIVNSRRGKMAIVQLDDNTGRLEATMFSTLYTEVQSKLQKDTILVIEGEVREDEYNGGFTMNANSVMSFIEAREKSARYVAIQLTEQQVNKQLTQNLLNILQANQGRCPVVVNYQNKNADIRLRLGNQWCIMPSDDFINQLEMLIGREKVQVYY